MNMKNIKKYWQVLLVVGIITSIFGILNHKNMTGISPNSSMFSGMIQGAGFAFMAIGALKLIQLKRTSAEKLKEKEIKLKDERNIELTRISLSVSSTVATLIFALLSFIFMGMGYIVPALMSIAAMYIQLISLLVAYKYFENKM